MTSDKRPNTATIRIGLLLLLVTATISIPALAKEKKGKGKDPAARSDPYAEIVFPPPPDQPRIKLERILEGRADIESRGSKWKKALIGASPQSEYDSLKMPLDVAFDSEGRILVTDPGTHALVRFDVKGEIYDVLGTRSAPALIRPMAVSASADGMILVADAGLRLAAAFDADGKIHRLYGNQADLRNPTDAVFGPDGRRVFVADSRRHRIFIFDRDDGTLIDTLGESGSGEGQFAFPTSLALGPEGQIFVVDQINSRVQVFTREGEFLEQFGSLGTGFGNFVRPKSIAVDEQGLIYVTDAAFNNFQLFDADLTLLTFVGRGGKAPGQFQGVTGIDVQGDWIAVADTLNQRVQLLRFLVPKTAE